MNYYDLTIIGAGWAGFSAAIKAEQRGLKVGIIEKDKLGGTCLNRGCIPTKTLIQSAKIYSLTKKSSRFGIQVDSPLINFIEIQKRKENIISQLHSGMQFMLKNKNINFISAQAKIISDGELDLGTEKRIKAKNILIATGSKPAELSDLRFDGKKIISSDDVLNLNNIPKSLLIIGGGVIGCEFASLFSIFGTEVTVVELMSQLLPQEDKEIARRLEAIFKKKGIKVHTNTDAQTVNLNNYDFVLLSIGRKPYIENLDKIGIKLDRNRILVDDYLRTSIPNIYAAGDCTGSIMLAHYAAYQGSIASENIANPNSMIKVENSAIPNCIFTEPEVASVGLNEEQAKQLNQDIKINKFDFQASGMARILDETEGFIKIVSDKKTDVILGASIIGAKATELIGILTLAVKSHLKTSQIKETIFAHPTLSESIAETLKTGHAI